MNKLKLILACSLVWLSIGMKAWDGVGHRIIADVAYHNLTPKAQAGVDKVLGKHGIIYEATWADEIRSDKKYDFSYQWHFQDLDDSLSTAQIKKLLDNPTAEGEHLFFALNQMQTRLKKNPSDAEALKFLVHFAGDLHQPMHLGRKSDLGGNKISMQWFGKTINQHALWDSYMIDNQKMSYTEFSQYLQDKFEGKKASYMQCSIQQSVEATYALRNEIYASDKSDTNNYHYVYYFSDKLDEMLFRGGMQLARILNGIYK